MKKNHSVKEMLGFTEGAFVKGQERQRPQQMKTGERGHGHMHGHGDTAAATEDRWRETGRWDRKGRAGSYCLDNKARRLRLSTQVRGKMTRAVSQMFWQQSGRDCARHWGRKVIIKRL